MINGKNCWVVEKIDKYGWVKRENLMFEGEYWDAVRKYNPNNSASIVIKPAEFIKEYSDNKNIEKYHHENYPKENYIAPKPKVEDDRKTSEKIIRLMNKSSAINETLISIYEQYEKCINIIDKKIIECCIDGINLLYIFHFNFIKKDEDLIKLKYFYKNMGFTFSYDQKENILKIQW